MCGDCVWQRPDLVFWQPARKMRRCAEWKAENGIAISKAIFAKTDFKGTSAISIPFSLVEFDFLPCSFSRRHFPMTDDRRPAIFRGSRHTSTTDGERWAFPERFGNLFSKPTTHRADLCTLVFCYELHSDGRANHCQRAELTRLFHRTSVSRSDLPHQSNRIC